MQGTWSDFVSLLAAVATGGGIHAVIGWRKPKSEAHKLDAEADKMAAEAEKIKADADGLVWGYARETIERLMTDVEELKAGRASRDQHIAMLQKANKECVAREKKLVRRIHRLETQISKLTPA